MYFRNYRFRKRRVGKCLKYRASEYRSTNNMGNGHKHCCNLDGGTITIFTDHSEHNSVGKGVC